MTDRDWGKWVHQWMLNAKLLLTLLATVSLSSIYGNSDTVKGWFHDSPVTVNYEARLDKMQKQIDKNTEWLK